MAQGVGLGAELALNNLCLRLWHLAFGGEQYNFARCWNYDLTSDSDQYIGMDGYLCP